MTGHVMKIQCLHHFLGRSAAPAPCLQQRLPGSEPQHASRGRAQFAQLPARRQRCNEHTVAAAPERSDISTRQALHKPSSAQTAKTIVDIVAHGTLCTVGEDGVPLGTYTNYVLDDRGMPVLRLRADAVHTANLRRSPKCSLFVQPGDRPAKLLARCTIIGEVKQLDEESSLAAAERHEAMHPFGIGVDAPQDTDLYFSLHVHQCFYVGGMGANSAAELLSQEEYVAAAPDPLREHAAFLVEQQNQQRAEDVLRICSHACSVRIDEMEHAQLLWIDELGLYAFAKLIRREGFVIRVPFLRPVTDERDARSTLTMLAQVAWEHERSYTPVMPELVGASS